MRVITKLVLDHEGPRAPRPKGGESEGHTSVRERARPSSSNEKHAETQDVMRGAGRRTKHARDEACGRMRTEEEKTRGGPYNSTVFIHDRRTMDVVGLVVRS